MSKQLAKSGLNPQQAEVVRLYTDPLLPTFGNKAESARKAGYKSVKVWESKAVQEAVELIQAMRSEAEAEVQEYMGSFVMDAARAWVDSLKLGEVITIEDPANLLGPPTDEERAEAQDMFDNQKVDKHGRAEYATVQDALGAIVKGRLERADQITKSNRVALMAVKERNAAAEMIARYVLGHPEQRIRHTKDDQPVDLSHLDNEDLMELGQGIEEILNARRATVSDDDDPSVVEAEWEEADDGRP